MKQPYTKMLKRVKEALIKQGCQSVKKGHCMYYGEDNSHCAYYFAVPVRYRYKLKNLESTTAYSAHKKIVSSTCHHKHQPKFNKMNIDFFSKLQDIHDSWRKGNQESFQEHIETRMGPKSSIYEEALWLDKVWGDQ